MAAFAPLRDCQWRPIKKEVEFSADGRGGDLHGMADESRVPKTVLVEKPGQVLGHGRVVMAGVVRRVAMIPEVLGLPSGILKKGNIRARERGRQAYHRVHRSAQVTGESSSAWSATNPAIGRVSWPDAYLLMPLLFFFEPKRPCRNNIGLDCPSVTGVFGSWRSKARGTALAELAKRRDAKSCLLPGRTSRTGLKSVAAILAA